MDRRAHADRCNELPEEVGFRFEKKEDRDTDLMIEVRDSSPRLRRVYDYSWCVGKGQRASGVPFV